MMKIVVCFTIFLSFCAIFATEKGVASCGYPPNGRVSFVRGGKTVARFQVGAAVTPAQWRRGLMFCTAIKKDEGLLFVFPTASEHSFWMKNTPRELAIIFISDKKQVIAVRHGIPRSSKYLLSGGKARFVVETLWESGKVIKKGDTVLIH